LLAETDGCHSPDDQKILEEEFLLNQRPDKATRLNIVSRVSLGEKEVQIWFQNRRQNSRKKSKLLASSDPLSDSPTDGLMINMSSTLASKDDVSIVSVSAESDESTISLSDNVTPDVETQNNMFISFQSTTSVHAQSSTIESSSQSLEPSSQSSSSAGYIANRRILTAPAEEDVEPLPLSSQKEIKPAAHPRTLTRSNSSYLRLSLTDDGLAKIVDRGVSSPQKPQESPAPAQTRPSGLRRSYSVAGLNEKPKPLGTRESGRKVPRVSGRSRDSRTWEFWCDSDARNSLIERAEQETSGSAAEAIGMIRSKSNRALQMNANKMNSPITGHSNMDTSKKARPPLKKSLTHAGIVGSDLKKATGTKAVDDIDIEHLNEESDKENHDPKSRHSSRSGPFIRTSTKVLGENDNIKSQSNSLNALLVRERQNKDKISPSSSPLQTEDEVVAFMAGSDDHSICAPREEDMDCIQGLLSLKGGNWS
jgi:hypothetical protein